MDRRFMGVSTIKKFILFIEGSHWYTVCWLDYGGDD